MTKINISSEELARQTNYIIVNSRTKKSYTDTKEIAESYIEMNEKFKVIYTPPEDIGLQKVEFNMISIRKRGLIYAVDNKGQNIVVTLPEIIHKLKYGMLIISSHNLGVSDYNQFLQEGFEKKSIDVIKHQTTLFLTEPELMILRKSIDQAKSGERIQRNFAFRIYPNETFEFNKETFIKLKKQHESIDVLGIMLSQYCVNHESALAKKEAYNITSGNRDLLNEKEVSSTTEKYVYYNYISRIITGANYTTIRGGLFYLIRELELNTDIANFALRTWTDEEIPKDPDKKEEIILEEKDIDDDDFPDDEYINDAVEKTVSKILMQQAQVTNEDEAIAFYTKEYEEHALDGIIEIQEFINKVETEMQNNIKAAKDELDKIGLGDMIQ